MAMTLGGSTIWGILHIWALCTLRSLEHLDFWGLCSLLIADSWDCSGPQVCEIGDWKISRRPSVKISQSPHEARSAEWGD